MNAAELREKIENANDLRIEPVSVPEWPDVNGHLFVRTMGSKERGIWETHAAANSERSETLRELLASQTMCDEAGEPVFTDADVAMLGKKSSAALFRVFEASRKLNPLSDDDITELVKNSDAAQSGDSG